MKRSREGQGNRGRLVPLSYSPRIGPRGSSAWIFGPGAGIFIAANDRTPANRGHY